MRHRVQADCPFQMATSAVVRSQSDDIHKNMCVAPGLRPEIVISPRSILTNKHKSDLNQDILIAYLDSFRIWIDYVRLTFSIVISPLSKD